jgi:putative oxygen-independent coproporphyrinogen III oxidase
VSLATNDRERHVAARAPGAGGVRHLYIHLPFCGHRCGYCDFVTVVGRRGQHAAYVDALLAELTLERDVLVEQLETIFLGGGTPTFTVVAELARLLEALPEAKELTVEANPETVTADVARALRGGRVNRVSLGAQSFQPNLLRVLERRASPEDVRRAVHTLRGAGFDNISLDLLYGIPGQTASDLDRDLVEALSLEPEHLSCYELEAKLGTRFTHAHGGELARQAEAMEGYFEQVVDTLTSAGYRWYETANFCLVGEAGRGRDLRARHNLAYWRGRDYLGLGVGAVSTIDGVRRRNLPSLGGYFRALAAGRTPPREVEELDLATRTRERLMLGLRLDEPVQLVSVATALDGDSLQRMVEYELVEFTPDRGRSTLTLTRRGRFLGDGVTAELLT